MTDYDEKTEKKRIKAEAKAAKAETKVRIAAVQNSTSGALKGPGRIPDGVGIAIHKRNGGSELVVSGLRDDQLKRLLPQVNREVLITITEDENSFRAALMRFVREGIFQTIIKVAAGLIVGYLLLMFGLN